MNLDKNKTQVSVSSEECLIEIDTFNIKNSFGDYTQSFSLPYTEFIRSYLKFDSIFFNKNKNENFDYVNRIFSLNTITLFEIYQLVDFYFNFVSTNSSGITSLFIPNGFLLKYLEAFNKHSLFTNINDLVKFYYDRLFHYLYFEYKVKSGIIPTITEINNIEVEKYVKIIQNKLSNENDDENCIIKNSLSITKEFREEIFSINYLIQNFLPSKSSSSLLIPNMKIYKKEIAKILPEKHNFLNDNRNIVKYIRKSESFHLQSELFNISLNRSTLSSFTGFYPCEGLKQSKVGLRISVINLGPGDIEIFVLNHQNKQNLSRLLKVKFNASIDDKSSNWLADLDLLISNRIEVQYTVLRKYEMLNLTLDCLYFYMSRGDSVTFQYEYGLKEINQFEMFYLKQKDFIDKGIKSELKIGTILLDILNKDLNLLDLELIRYAYEKIKAIAFEQQEDYACKQIPEPSDVNARFCDFCYVELFNLSSFCRVCDLMNNGEFSLKCLKCVKSAHKEIYKENCHIVVYFKYKRDSLESFIKKVENFINKSKDLENQFFYQNEISENYKYYINKEFVCRENKSLLNHVKLNDNSISIDKMNDVSNMICINPYYDNDILKINFCTPNDEFNKDESLDWAKIDQNFQIYNLVKVSSTPSEDQELNFLDF